MIAHPPVRNGELARVMHSESAAIIVCQSKDGARVDIEIWTKHDNGWRLGGFTPSFAGILLDQVIAALIGARDARAGGG